MKKRIQHFAKKIGRGLQQEYNETKQIPYHIRKKNFKAAGEQIGDIGKMVLIAFVWILPAGAILSGFIIKFSQKMRPSAFQTTEESASAPLALTESESQR